MGVITEIKVFIVCYLALLDLSPSLAQRVTMPPGMSARLTLSPSNRTVKKFIGDTYVISCLNGSADTEWLTPQNEKVNTTKLGRMRQQPRRGGGGIDLFLTRIMADDAGMYSCRSKSTTISFNLIVVKPIAFDNSLAFQTAVEGSTYTVRCVAHGQSNTPKLYWKVDQKSPQGPKYKVVKDGLIVHNVTREDAKKNYVCHAMDIDSPMPDSKLMTITLSVTRKPTSMSSGNINATFAWAVLGEWASLACKMDAEPIPTFEWFSPTNEKLTFTDETSIVNDINDSEYTSTLQIIVSKDSKFGNYTCRARNDMGVTDQVFILQKGNKPATPFLEIDAVGPAEAKIRVQQFKAPPGTTLSTEIDLPITDFVVEHKLSTDTIWFPGKYKPYEQGFVLQGLQPATTYHVRTALKNVASTGTFSPPIQVGTADPVPQISSTAAATTTLTTVQSTASTPENITEGEHQCSEDQFKCKTQRYCVPLRWKCDGEPDCSDSSDEDKEMCRPTAAEATIEKLMSQVSPAVSAALPLFASPSSRLLFITRNNQSAKDTNTSGATTSSSSVSPNFVTRNLNTSPNVLQEADSETEEESSEEEEPKTTTTNQTTVTTSNVNNTKITTTTNVVATVVQTVLKQGSVKIITTKKEEIVTERIESNDLK